RRERHRIVATSHHPAASRFDPLSGGTIESRVTCLSAGTDSESLMSDTSKPANAPSVPGAAPAAPSDGRSGARQPLVIGNWKMNGDLSGNERLLGALRAQLDRALLDRVGVAVCPPYPFISQAATWLGDTG